jgi:hypothetical protein
VEKWRRRAMCVWFLIGKFTVFIVAVGGDDDAMICATQSKRKRRRPAAAGYLFHHIETDRI